MKTRMFQNLTVFLACIVTVTIQTPAQIFAPVIGKLPGRFHSLEPETPSKKWPPPQQVELSSNDSDGSFKPHDGTKDLKRQNLDLMVPNLRSIPFWSDTFDYHGLRYRYKMVGKDPKRGSSVTVIPVELIPIRWVFSNGMVIDASMDIVDGQTPVQGIINSPIFQNYDFISGGTSVGDTQYGDAFQRANFWNSIVTRSPNYHVELAQPTVMPTQTVVVPDDKVAFTTLPESGYVIPEIDGTFLNDLDHSLHASLDIQPESLPIIVWGSVSVAGGGLGYHGAYQTGNSIQSFISTGYIPVSAYGWFSDVSILSHEIIEWMDDPFGDNHSAGWNDPFFLGDPPPPRSRCDSWFHAHDLLETADPFEVLGPFTDTPVVLNGSTYHLAEGAFIDFFTRSRRSRSVNGQYSFFEIGRPYGLDTPPSIDCVSSLYTDNRFFTVPGSVYSFAYGMNNTGSIVGFYIDTVGVPHGFRKDRSGYLSLDFPGATGTVLTDINDSGAMVGYHFDPDGFPQGFCLKHGRFTSIVFPGSTDTVPEKINSEGVIVGAYDATQPVTHGFVLDSKGLRAVDAPFGLQSEAASINDLGTIAGNSWTTVPGPASGFLKTRRSLDRFDFPDETSTSLTSINISGDLSGYFTDSYYSGFVRLYGYPYVTYPFSYEYIVIDINDDREILGHAYNFEAEQYQPFVARPALASSN